MCVCVLYSNGKVQEEIKSMDYIIKKILCWAENTNVHNQIGDSMTVQFYIIGWLEVHLVDFYKKKFLKVNMLELLKKLKYLFWTAVNENLKYPLIEQF